MIFIIEKYRLGGEVTQSEPVGAGTGKSLAEVCMAAQGPSIKGYVFFFYTKKNREDAEFRKVVGWGGRADILRAIDKAFA